MSAEYKSSDELFSVFDWKTFLPEDRFGFPKSINNKILKENDFLKINAYTKEELLNGLAFAIGMLGTNMSHKQALEDICAFMKSTRSQPKPNCNFMNLQGL